MDTSTIHARHLQDLRESGLTDETIEKLGIDSEGRPEEIDLLLNAAPDLRPRMSLELAWSFRTQG